MGKKALIVTHHQTNAGTYGSVFSSKGLPSDIRLSKDSALEKVGIDDYTLYVVEANLGNPMTNDISGMLSIYEAVKPRVEGRLARFVAISATQSAVDETLKRGIEAKHKRDVDYEYLQSLAQNALKL